jgi:hypothetical protein
MADVMTRAEHTEAQEIIFQKMVKLFEDKQKEDRTEAAKKEEEAQRQTNEVLSQLADLMAFAQRG